MNVTVVRIFSGNVPQFLQVNSLEGDREIQRVGRPVLRKTVSLNPTASMRPRWTRYALDLSEMARKDAQPGIRLVWSLARGLLTLAREWAASLLSRRRR